MPRPSLLNAMWKNGMVRSTVGASATTALVATMMFSGGGFNPAVASPLDKQDTGVERQLLNAVDGFSAAVDSSAKNAEAPADAATTDGVSSPKVDAPVGEVPKPPAEKKSAAPAKAVEPKKQEAQKPVTPTKAPVAPVKKGVTDDQSAAPLADESADAPVVMAVPPAPNGGAVINVEVRSLRSASGAPTAPPAGSVTLRLRTGSNSNTDKPGNVIAQPWATCTNDAQGDCSFSIPSNQMGKYFWIENQSASSGYYLNETLITGSNTNSTGDTRFGQTPYVFRTGRITARTSPYEFPNKSGMPTNTQVGNQTMENTTDRKTENRWRTNGFWPASLKNPRYQPTCKPGLKVALVVDLSTSMTSASNAGLKGARAASKAMFGALAGAESNAKVDLFTFGSGAPATGQANLTNTFSALLGNVNSFNSRVDSFDVSGTQYTNWDAGLEQVAKATGAYDFAIVLTDGNPTRSRAANNGMWTDFAHLEHSILSANAIKAEGTQILTFGVGEGISGVKRGDNLAAVSGTTQWTSSGKIGESDYALTDDWGVVSSQLASLAKGLSCAASITVEKTEINASDTSNKGKDWEFRATNTTQTGTLTPLAAQKTNAAGLVDWNLSFDKVSESTGVAIQESSKPGWEMTSAVCTINGAATNAQIDTATGKINVPKVAVGDDVLCKVVNTSVPTSLTVEKKWFVNGTEVSDAKNAETLNGATAKAVVTKGTTTTNPAFDTATGGYAKGDKVKIGETFTESDRCVLTDQLISFAVGSDKKLGNGLDVTLDVGENIATITNKIDCDATLTLVKKVDNKGSEGAAATDWKLSAIKSGVNTNMENVVTGTSKNVVPGTYKLSEANGPSGYDLTNLTCVNGSNPISEIDLKNPNVALKIGDNVTCTFTNTRIGYLDLDVSKTVEVKFDRDYDWTIDKSVDEKKKTVNSATGDVDFNYSVVVYAGEPLDTSFKASGSITLTNPNTIAIENVTLRDELAGATCVIKDAQSETVTGSLTVPSGESKFSYTCDMSEETSASSAGINTVTATWTKADYFGTSGKATGSDAYDFAKVAPKVTDESIIVKDTNFDLATLVGGNVVTVKQAPKTFNYTKSWPAVAGRCKDYVNTADFVEKDSQRTKSDSETVTVCAEQDLVVFKDAAATYDRDYNWMIEKQVDKTSFNVDGDGKVKANYTVTATQNGHTDSGWKLDGNITVHNPNAFGSITADVTDALNDDGITCSVTDGQDVKIGAGDTVELAYTCDVAAGIDAAKYTGFLKNTATAAWGEGRSASSDKVDVDFTLGAITDASVYVFDDKTNPDAEPVKLGTATLDGNNKFTYEQELAGAAGKCTTFTNTAVVKEEVGSNDDNSDSADVEVCVEDELTVVKTVAAEFTRDHDWKIAKEAKKTSFTVDENGKVNAEYKVTATLDGYNDHDWTMSGSIDVFNPNLQGEMKVNVSDVAQLPGAVCTVANGGTDVLVPAASEIDGKTVPGKATVSYDCDLTQGVDPSDYTGKKNTATITWIGVDGQNRTSTFDAAINFEQTKAIDETVTIVDDQTVKGTETVLGTATLNESPKDFSTSVSLQGTSGKCTTFTNTAVVQETAGSDANNTDSSDVEVCGKAILGIDKTANASFDREYLWSLAKKANDPTSVEIGLDGEATFDYMVAAKPEGYKDTNHSLTGEITLTNANEFEGGAINATVTDVVDIKGLTCKIAAKDIDDKTPGLQVLVPAASAGEKALVLPYECTGIPANEDYEGTNTATASWKNVAGTVVSAAKTVDVKYEQKGSKNHEVEVLDDKAGTVTEPVLLGKAIWNEEGKTTDFPYSLTFKNDNELATDGTCVDHVNTATIPAADKKATETVSVCVKVGAPTVEKTVTGTSQNADGTWDITYDVVVTGDGLLKGRYSLEDTLRFGTGITVNSAAWTGPVAGDGDSWDLDAKNLTEVLATDKLIEAKGIDTYKVTVNAIVAAGVTGSADANCELTEGEDGTGFLNSATVTANGEKTDAEACATPSIPTAAKTFVSAVQQDDASWIVKYSLVVDNSAGKDGFYNLSDTPDFATGIVINGRTVTAPEGISVVEDQTDGTIVAGQTIKAGEIHTYGVEFAVTVPVAGIPVDELSCEVGESGKGFFNTATLSSGNDDVVSEACGPVEEGGVPSITKDVIGTEQLVDGSWNVTYEVRVKANADFATKYDLVDELKFGAGIKINSASWTGLTNGNFVDGKAQMAKDKVLAKGTEDDIYTVTVNATVPTKVIGAEAGNCELTEGEKGTGFLNSATISGDGWNKSDDACATPTEMKISKDAVSDAVQQENGSWNVVYLLNVDNTDGHDGVYSLSDIPAFSKGVSINNWSVQAADEDTPSIDLVEQAYTDGVIRTDQDIDANAKHSYRVTFNVEVALADSIGNATCGAEGGEAGNGFFNTAELAVGNDKTEDTDCVEVPKVGASTVGKTATGTNQDANGNWVVSYQIQVKATGENTSKYTLEDTLAYGDGATILEAAWAGPDEGESGTWENPNEQRAAALATDRLIKPGTTDIYTVNVVASVAKGATGTPLMDCKIGEGEDGKTGFLNTVKLGNNGSTIGTDEACSTPAAPIFDKQALELVQHEDADGNWDGTWDASYTLRVTNPATEGQQVNYELSDTPAFAKGVIVNDRSVSSDDVAVNEGWHGKDSTDDVIINGQVLDAGATHNFNVIINVSPTADINDADRVCAVEGTEGGNGLLNTGTVNSGNESSTDDACLEIPAPSSNVVKTAVSSEENADGSWDIHYTVVVNNTSDVAARYDLADTLRFGVGITATNANWSLEGTEKSGNWENPGTEPSTVLAKGRDLEARDSHTYLVHVVANLEDGVIGSEAGTCQAEDSETNGGFLNEATLVANGKTSASRDCLAPEKNPRGYSMVKTSDPANGETVWPGEEIAYTITVKNTGEFVYTGAVITDEMSGWQQAATFNEGSLKLSGGESVIDGSRLVWTVGDLAVGESKTLTYTVTVDPEMWDQILVNVASGNGDVPPSVTTHPTPEYHKLPEPPVVVDPPVVEHPTPELPGTETEIPETPGTATEIPQLPGVESQVPPRKPVVPLANTGASNATLWILGSGALVMLLGAGLVIASRRRKSDES